jgi:hypothetical protein
VQTSQSQIIQFREAAVLTWSYVVHVKSERKEFSGEMTVLATIIRSLPDLPNHARIHELGFKNSWLSSTKRALDCMTARRFPICE